MSGASRLAAPADTSLGVRRAALWGLLAAKVVSGWGVQWDIVVMGVRLALLPAFSEVLPSTGATLGALVLTLLAALAGGAFAGWLAARLGPAPPVSSG